MTYVLALNGAVLKYPYTLAELRKDNPNTSFSSTPPDSLLAEWNMFPVALVAQPTPTLEQNVVENTPQLVNGTWTQRWLLMPASAAEIAERMEAAAQQSEFDAAKLDAWIIQFLAMTPAQAQTFVENNSATLAALRTNVARLAYALRVLVRREFNR